MQNLRTTGNILPVIFYLVASVSSGTEPVCPDYCECDIFQQLKRAVCQNSKLISIDLAIPKQADILDVSQNYINKLDDKIFLKLELTNLKLLNLSHNLIHQIHFNAFDGMEQLKTLDLSYNAIEYFTKSWFKDWVLLEELYLRGNNLMSINKQPRIAVASLKVLDLANCGITSLKSNLFQMVPNLEVLDISHNYIKLIQVQVLMSVPKLVEFRADGNYLKCNTESLLAVQNYTKTHKILYTNVCTENIASTSINQRVHKFEKIVMGSDNDLESTTTRTNRKNSWIFDENDKDNDKTVNKCQNQKEEVSSQKDDDDDDDESLLMTIIKLSPWLVTTMIFAYGVFLGMVISCCVKMCWSPRLARRSPKKRSSASNNENQPRETQRQRRSNSGIYRKLQTARASTFQHSEFDDDDSWSWDDTLMMNEFDLANSTPVVTRKMIP